MSPIFSGSLAKYPARASLWWYLGLMATGAAALHHPICRGRGGPISWLEAVFTSASAACVTGLTVRSTEVDFSWVGQLVILALVQLGGVGIMTVTTYIVFRLGGRTNLRRRLVVSETLGADDDVDLRWVLRNVFFYTVALEAAGALILAARFALDMPPGEALWHSVFHSISAFCNAGFSLRDSSLIAYQKDVVVNWAIGLLIIAGGLGFPVMLDLQRARGSDGWKGYWENLHLHTKVVLLATGALLAASTAAFAALEWNGQFQAMHPLQRVQAAAFHAISCRTAGFNTVDVGEFTSATLFITVLLMMIGAGPCSTAGGFKVSTLAVLVLHAWATFRGRSRATLFRRTVSREALERAAATAMLFSVVAAIALTLLEVVEHAAARQFRTHEVFLDLAFETASALGTVGLSTGVTPELSDGSRFILIVLMFVGRLGPISAFAALSRDAQRETVEYPNEEPLVG